MPAVLELKPIPADPAATTPTTSPLVEIVKKGISSGAGIDVLTGLYLKLRNSKKDLEGQAKLKLAPLNEGIELIENHFLAKMIELGVDSLKNDAGTPYKSERVTVTVADNSAFVDYVLTRALSGLAVSDDAKTVIKTALVESGQLALIEARASKSAVEALLEETQELPAGLNRRVEVTVNVRAS